MVRGGHTFGFSTPMLCIIQSNLSLYWPLLKGPTFHVYRMKLPLINDHFSTKATVVGVVVVHRFGCSIIVITESSLAQAWPTSGPRATSGPRSTIMWPKSYFFYPFSTCFNRKVNATALDYLTCL